MIWIDRVRFFDAIRLRVVSTDLLVGLLSNIYMQSIILCLYHSLLNGLASSLELTVLS